VQRTRNNGIIFYRIVSLKTILSFCEKKENNISDIWVQIGEDNVVYSLKMNWETTAVMRV
jgi:hypothetical protein